MEAVDPRSATTRWRGSLRWKRRARRRRKAAAGRPRDGRGSGAGMSSESDELRTADGNPVESKTEVTIAGDWSKPAQVLIEKVSDAIGGGFRPWQLKRVARAEAEVAVVKAEAEGRARQILSSAVVPDTPVGLRAVHRMVTEEVRKQINIESIAVQAAERLMDDAKPEGVDQDFITHLFDRASNTSDAEMQSLWASLLAGEANAPGSFSKRTVDLVGSLDKRDAELFTKFCSCCWMVLDDLTALTLKKTRVVMGSELGVDFTALAHLDSIGLIRFDSVGGFKREFNAANLPADLRLHYFGRPIHIQFIAEPVELGLGAALLTSAGKELSRISGATMNDKIFDATVGDFAEGKLAAFSPLKQL